MEISLNEKQMTALAGRTAQMVVTLLKNAEPAKPAKRLVGIKEAAGILGISEYHLRRIKNQFPYVKRGTNQQARLLFEADALLSVYSHNNYRV